MITPRIVNELAALARMRLTPKERASLRHDLEKILEYVQTLETFDAAGVLPSSHITGLENVMRNDEAREPTSQAQELVDAFVLKKERWAKVPKIIHKEA